MNNFSKINRIGLTSLIIILVMLIAACGGDSSDDEIDLPTRFPSIEPTVIVPTDTPEPSSTQQSASVDEFTPEANISESTPQIEMPRFEPTATPVVWYVIGTEPANVYDCPDVDCDVVHVFEPGEEIEVISSSDIWHQILWEGNTDVYVLREHTELSPFAELPPGTVGALTTPATQGPPQDGSPPPGSENVATQSPSTDTPPEGTLSSGTSAPATSGPPINSSPPPGANTSGNTQIAPTEGPPMNDNTGGATVTPFNPLTPPPTPK